MLICGSICYAQSPPITFNQHIAPILIEHCAPCHRSGEAGGFSLLTWADAKKRAKLIEQVTQSRTMPPWLPEHGFGEFADENRLTDQQIDVIHQWVAHGAPRGSAEDARPLPVFILGWQRGKPDLILTVSTPFRVPAEGPDVFWNFILPSGVAQTRFVKSLEVRPGNARSVHHANVLLDPDRSSRHLEKHHGDGFGGMDLNIETARFDPDSHFLFWKPGGRPWEEPPGMQWKLEAGSDLVLNVHLHPTGKEELVQPSIGLYFTPDAPTLTPQLLQMERDNLLDIPAGTQAFMVSDDFVLPVDATVLAVYPHAHYLGRLLEGYATLPDGSLQPLIRIPQWNPAWQAVYHLRRPVFLPKGTTISMRFHYDNSSKNPQNPNSPPKQIKAGNQSTDEMGHLWLQVLTAGGQESRERLHEALMRHRLRNDPSNADAHLSLGSLLLNRRQYAEATLHFQDSLRLKPGQAIAFNGLGAAFQAEGNLSEASNFFTQALDVDAGYRNARFNLANVLFAQGKWEAAAVRFRQLLVEEPTDAGAREQLIALLIEMGNAAQSASRLPDAAAHYGELTALRPNDANIRNNFAIVLARQGEFDQAVEQFEAALRIDPTHAVARRNLEAVRKKIAWK